MPVEGALNQRQNERSEVSGEAPQALPVEGALNPNNCSRFLHADRPYLHVYSRPCLSLPADLPPLYTTKLPTTARTATMMAIRSCFVKANSRRSVLGPPS